MAEDENARDGGMVDPLSTAVAVAGKGGKEIVTPKIRELLLGPLAKAYGDHWGANAEEHLRKKREERRARNAHSHVRAVALTGPRRTFEDVASEPSFDEWLAGAADVDPDIDPDLANFWRAALVALDRGDTARLRLLRIVSSLGPDDAVYLASGVVDGGKFRAPRTWDIDYAQRLVRAGVFETPGKRMVRNPRLLVAAVAMPLIIFAILSNDYSATEISRLWISVLQTFAMPLSLMVFFVGLALVAREYFGHTQVLTADGMRLLSLLDQVRHKADARSEMGGESAPD